MNKHPNDKLICKFCGKSYTRCNGSHHRKSKICKAYQDAIKKFNELLLEDKNKIKSFDDLIKKPFTNEKGKMIYLNNFQLRFLNKI